MYGIPEEKKPEESDKNILEFRCQICYIKNANGAIIHKVVSPLSKVDRISLPRPPSTR